MKNWRKSTQSSPKCANSWIRNLGKLNQKSPRCSNSWIRDLPIHVSEWALKTCPDEMSNQLAEAPASWIQLQPAAGSLSQLQLSSSSSSSLVPAPARSSCSQHQLQPPPPPSCRQLAPASSQPGSGSCHQYVRHRSAARMPHPKVFPQTRHRPPKSLRNL